MLIKLKYFNYKIKINAKLEYLKICIQNKIS